MNDHASLEKAKPTSYDDLLDRDSRQVPATLRKRGVTDVGPIEIPTSWYTDAAIHEREIERIWKTRWQMVCRVDELRDVGDTWVYEVASLSFVIVRSDPQTIKAFITAACIAVGLFATARVRCPNLNARFMALRGAWMGGCAGFPPGKNSRLSPTRHFAFQKRRLPCGVVSSSSIPISTRSRWKPISATCRRNLIAPRWRTR